MRYRKIVLTDQEEWDLEVAYNKDENVILLTIDDGTSFTIKTDEWDVFISELNKIKSLLISEQ